MPPADSPKMRDVIRIAAKRRDVFLHPLERRDLIHEGVVTNGLRTGGFGQGREREEPKTAHTVIEADAE